MTDQDEGLNEGITLHSGEGRSFWVLGGLYTFKVTGDDTDGNHAVIEVVSWPQNGPPPHIHHREDEMFYVLEGEFSFLYGNSTFAATAGSVVYIPKGTLHTFKNVRTAPGRFIVVITPAGFERLFEEIGEAAVDKSSPSPFNPATVERLMALAPKYNLEIKAP